jgi:putative membrane protein
VVDVPGTADWAWRPEVALPLVIMSGAFAIGHWRLARRAPPAVAAWRAAAAGAGMASIVIALLSPLDGLAQTLFAAHMVQHLLLIAVAAPCLLLAQPFPALLWGLPKPLRARVGRLVGRGRLLRRVLLALTAMPVAWFIHVLMLWLWHLPVAYEAALADRLVHDVEHIVFFGSAIVFWWPLIGPSPRLRTPAPRAIRIVYLVLAAFQSALLGILLTMSPRPLYARYATTSALWGLTPAEDQALGGVVMWGLGGSD